MKEKGLNDLEVKKLQAIYGKNELVSQNKENFFIKILKIITEPMFLLLLIAATIYFILGNPVDGIIMLIFVIGVISIDIIQEWKTDKTLESLKKLSEPKITALRNAKKIAIPSSEIVPGDIIFIHEGVKIPADGYVIKCSSLKVDESLLTGESLAVYKTDKPCTTNDYWRNDYCYQGTLVTGGTGIIKVDKIGFQTEYGKIGANLNKIKPTKTPLQKQLDYLVKTCSIIAIILFICVTIFTFINLLNIPLKERLIESILSGITLAMAMIPEEFPVVLTVFLSMGAWRLAKKNSLVKKLPAVETLGAVSVLCVDKTGTITKNQMEISTTTTKLPDEEFTKLMCLSCQEETYDPMEKAMFKYAKQYKITKKTIFNGSKIKEYPFTDESKMTAQAWKIDNQIILSCKGSPESVLKICKLDNESQKEINETIIDMQKSGLRVIAVASKNYQSRSDLPDDLNQASLEYSGLVGFIDPPKENIASDIKLCRSSGIKVVMITGDNGLTASSIAESVGIDNQQIITGEMLNKMTDKELQEAVKHCSIFSRVIPEQKMKIVKAFQANHEVVAMTGDGVNDASALKQADIGISMGHRGSEVSREAADLILLDDNFSTIVDTIKDGRRIYDNIKKSIGYILLIHLPIALSSLIASILGIPSNNLMLLPVHVVLLELIIDPMCSIVLERQPAETNIMNRPPRNIDEQILNKNTLIKSLFQGIIIFLATFITYYSYLPINILKARTIGLVIVIISNIFLLQVNLSHTEYAYQSLKKLFQDKFMIFVNLIIILGTILIVYSPLNIILKLTPLKLSEFILAIFISFISVFWYELVKLYHHQFTKSKQK